MKSHLAIIPLLSALALGVAQTAPEAPSLPHVLTITPEIKRAFREGDAIEVRQVTGTVPKFQVGGTYRVTGVCRQHTLKSATLYVGNTAERGEPAIVPVAGSSLSMPLPPGVTEFDVTFTLRRPGLVHVTIYDMDSQDKHNNAYAGIYLGDSVLRR